MKCFAGKKLLPFLSAFITILVSSGICWADWILFDKTEDAEFYYDNEDIKHFSSKVVTVWTKHVYTKKGISEMVNLLGPRYETLDHSVNLWEFDCVGQLVMSLSVVYFSTDRRLIETKGSDGRWEFVTKIPMLQALYDKVCK